MEDHLKILTDVLNLLSKLPYKEILQELEVSPKIPRELNQKFKVTFIERRLSVNGVTIIHENAKWINCVFRVLLKQHLDDIYAGKPKDEYTFLSIKQITKALESEVRAISHQEQQVRGPIYKIRKCIKNAFDTAEINDFIEIRRNGGVDDKGFGYRLNPFKISL
jgi:hypothetical protein